MSFSILRGDAIHIPLADESVQCVVMSPPYWALRKYEDVEPTVWPDGWFGCLGLEPTSEQYVANMVAVFREVRRVLRKDGTVWLNLGDSYTDKQLQMIPARVALALQADGWWLRSDVIWAKGLSFCEEYSGSCMPESVGDRPTNAHEHMFLLMKNARYYYDADAVREEESTRPQNWTLRQYGRKELGVQAGSRPMSASEIGSTGRNLRNVWAINPGNFPGAHFAVMPPALVEPCIKAGTSERGACPKCGAPWERVVKSTSVREQAEAVRPVKIAPSYLAIQAAGVGHINVGKTSGVSVAGNMPKSPIVSTLGWRPICPCYDEAIRSFGPVPIRFDPEVWRELQEHLARWLPPVPCVVVDPLSGAGTVPMVADRLGRYGIGLDLSGEYCRMARRRCYQDAPLLAWAKAAE